MKDVSLYEKVPPLENSFDVKFKKYTQNDNLIPHWHEHVELLYFYAGECVVTCNGKTFSVKKGDLIVINSTEIHSYIVEDYIDYACLLIYPSFFNGINYANILFQNHILNDVQIAKYMKHISSEYQQNTEVGNMLLKSYTYSLIAHLMQNYIVGRISEKELNCHATNLKRLNTAFEYISKNYNEKISTSILADLCYLNESYFCRFFKSATGKTVTQYINEYRIEKAAMLLQNTTDSITDIAANAGFDDANYFTRIFKKLKKQTPMEYRNEDKY